MAISRSTGPAFMAIMAAMPSTCASALARPRPAARSWHRSSPPASGGTGRRARARRRLSRSRQAQGRRHKARSPEVPSRAVLDASSTWALPAASWLTHLHEARSSPGSKGSRAAHLTESPHPVSLRLDLDQCGRLAHLLGFNFCGTHAPHPPDPVGCLWLAPATSCAGASFLLPLTKKPRALLRE